MIRKRKFAVFIIVALLLLFVPFSGCVKEEFLLPAENGKFSVHYLNVGQGDCIFINFDDGKSMLIDCGSDNEDTANFIISAVTDVSGGVLDYMVLTHPDVDHVGNAYRIAEKLVVKKAYIPKIENRSLFYSFDKAVSTLEKQNTLIEISDATDYLTGDDYFLAIIYPTMVGDGNIYDEINVVEFPTEEQTNALSAVVYLRYKNVRFLFTGDADVTAEKTITEYYATGFYKHYYLEEIDLERIDFLKVAHHGSANSSSKEFLELLKPANAVISVGGANNYGHPSTTTLQRLLDVNEQIKIWRTDYCGTVSVKVDFLGNVEVTAQA